MKPPREILLKRLDETTIDDLRKLNAVLFPVKYAVRKKSVVLKILVVVVARSLARSLARALFFQLTNSLSLSLSLSGIVLPGLRGGWNVHVVGVRVFF